MSNERFKLPSKAIRKNKKKATLHIGSKVYYDSLPDGLTKKTVKSVHDWDDQYLAACISAGAKEAKDMKNGNAALTVDLPTGICRADFTLEDAPLVVVSTDYGADTAVGLALLDLSKTADQTVS